MMMILMMIIDTTMISDIAIPEDARIETKELGKLTKYRDLAIETSHSWMKHTSMVPMVIGADLIQKYPHQTVP